MKLTNLHNVTNVKACQVLLSINIMPCGYSLLALAYRSANYIHSQACDTLILLLHDLRLTGHFSNSKDTIINKRCWIKIVLHNTSSNGNTSATYGEQHGLGRAQYIIGRILKTQFQNKCSPFNTFLKN